VIITSLVVNSQEVIVNVAFASAKVQDGLQALSVSILITILSVGLQFLYGDNSILDIFV
jgi:hypothetical protein